MSEEQISSSSSSSSSSDEESKSALNPAPSPLESAKAGNENEKAAKKEEEKKSTANNNNASKKKRKRRQRSKSEDERELIEAQKERYDRLIYTARKQLHKSAKQIRTFLLQKEIRKQSSKGGDNVSTGINAKKSLDLDVVTSQAIRQLGLYHCDPRFKIAREETTTEDGPTEADDPKAADTAKEETNNKRKKGSKKDNRKDDNAPPVIPAPLASDDPQKPLVDAVLTHKRFSKSLEEWNDKVTEYRRWCMKLEQRNNPNPFDEDLAPSKRSKKNKNKQKRAASSIADAGLQATVENESSLFCTLGGAIPDVMEKDEFNKYSQYGPGSELGEAPKRKNRMGQRQRRAKAMAIEAKKQGRSHEYQSANWREPKPKEGKDDVANEEGKRKSRGRGRETNRYQRSFQTKDRDYSKRQHEEPNTSHQAEEKQHPSWAAKQAQSTGIVAFKGTKITF